MGVSRAVKESGRAEAEVLKSKKGSCPDFPCPPKSAESDSGHNLILASIRLIWNEPPKEQSEGVKDELCIYQPDWTGCRKESGVIPLLVEALF